MWLRGQRTVLECGRDKPLMLFLKRISSFLSGWYIFQPAKMTLAPLKLNPIRIFGLAGFIYSNTIRCGWSEWEICGNLILFHENVSVTFQVWKREESLDRNLLLCEAGGREIHQVNSGLTTEEYERLACLSALMSNNRFFAAPCWECPSSSSPPEESSLCRWLRTGKIYLNSVLWGSFTGSTRQTAWQTCPLLLCLSLGFAIVWKFAEQISRQVNLHPCLDVTDLCVYF